jgi:choice-of-anchor C domain-containing protein
VLCSQRKKKEKKYMKSVKSVIGYIAGIGCICVSIARAELIVNGSFETGTDPGVFTTLNSVDSTTIAGWTVDTGNIDYIGTRWTAGDGARCLDLSGVSAGSIKQTLSCLTTGIAHRLTFLMAGNPEAGAGVKHLRVHIGAFSQDFTFDSSGKSTSNLGWITNSIDFMPLADSLDIRFQSLDASFGGPALDCVSVQQFPTTPCLANGSFESGTDPGVSTTLNSVDSTTITGWTVDTGSIDYIGTRWTAGDGARCLDLSGVSAGSIKQTLSCLTTGAMYRLSFLMAGNPELGGGLKHLRLHLGDYTQDYTFNSAGKTTSNLGWVTNTVDFTPLTASLELRFESQDPSWSGPALDRVAVDPIIGRDWIVNGSFECGTDPGVSTTLSSVDSTSITGWTIDTGNIDYIGTRWTAGDGDRCLDLNGVSAGSISQTVSCLVTGATYRLTFLLAGNPEAGAGVKTLRLTAAGSSQDYTFDSSGKSTSNLGWVTRTFDFVPTSTSVVITFASQSTGFGGPALDHVSLKIVQ